MLFSDRVEAGRRLAEALRDRVAAGTIVLGLPRGGVPVAHEIADTLRIPMDVIVVRKIGVPFRPELAMGAIGEDGARVVDADVLHRMHVTDAEFAEVERRERTELERRVRRFRRDRPPIPVRGRPVVVVDDGIATGSTARAACMVARAHGAVAVTLAAPVAPPGVIEQFADVADAVVCLAMPQGFYGIGQFYSDFRQLSDDQVIQLLDRAPTGDADVSPDPPERDAGVTLPVSDAVLAGHLTVPTSAAGIVVFAHGSGSSRTSPRNQYVASVLNDAGLGTLLFDLLTAGEGNDRTKVFDIELLSSRLIDAQRWLRADCGQQQSIGFFGASTGAAAALVAAAELGTEVAAVVSRGGRPDLAGSALSQVQAPTLLIVGGDDTVVLELNRSAQRSLRCTNRLEIVPGATHLFEEPGTLRQAARLAERWFSHHLGAPAAS